MSRHRLVRGVAVYLTLLSLGIRGAAAEAVPIHAGTRLLRSGPLVVEVGDPESTEFRWNQGVRFSPVAAVVRADLNGQAFLYAPIAGGVVDGGFVGGLAMEFDIGQEAFQPDPPGYNEGSNGDPFLKVGVGILRRDGGAYRFNGSYPIIESATTTATWHEDRAHFVQTLSGSANGYSCRLEEDVIVKNDRLIMHYRLANTGSKPFTTEQYIHNFLCFSGRPVGPDVRLSFPYDFTTSPSVAPWVPPARVRGLLAAASPTVVRVANMIEYMQTASGVPKIWVYKPEDYVGPELFAIKHTATRQQLIIENSIPAACVGIWTTNYQISPEHFVQITVAPGEQAEFTRTYRFRVDGFVPEDVTGDGEVSVRDLSHVSFAWLREPGDPGWVPAADISPRKDDHIDFQDVAALALQWRQESGLPDPVAHWCFDETAGWSAQDERGRYPGSLHNFAADVSPWSAGMLGGGLQFDGVDDYVEIAGYPGITGGHPRTVAAWIMLPEKPVANQTILAWGEKAPGRYWQLEVDTNRRLRFSCEGGFAVASAKPVADMRWHHVAVGLDPLLPESPYVSDVRLYVDTQPQTVYDLAEHPIDTGRTVDLRIGAPHENSESQPFAGTIDDLRLYDAALSRANVQAIYQEMFPSQ